MEKKIKKKKSKALPDFPPQDQKNRIEEAEEEKTEKEKKVSSLGTSEEENGNIQEICRDVIGIPFEVWAILKPGVAPLTDIEKATISKPLARIVVKYDVARFMKDEFLLLGFLGYSIVKRLRVPKNVDNDSGKTGKGKDDPGKGIDVPAPGPVFTPAA